MFAEKSFNTKCMIVSCVGLELWANMLGNVRNIKLRSCVAQVTAFVQISQLLYLPLSFTCPVMKVLVVSEFSSSIWGKSYISSLSLSSLLLLLLSDGEVNSHHLTIKVAEIIGDKPTPPSWFLVIPDISEMWSFSWSFSSLLWNSFTSWLQVLMPSIYLH